MNLGIGSTFWGSWRARVRASLLHLALSALVAATVTVLVLAVWYPTPYHTLSGGLHLLGMMLVVDMVLGPALTFLVYRPTKSHKELTVDFSLIALLQLAAQSLRSMDGVYGPPRAFGVRVPPPSSRACGRCS